MKPRVKIPAGRSTQIVWKLFGYIKFRLVSRYTSSTRGPGDKLQLVNSATVYAPTISS